LGHRVYGANIQPGERIQLADDTIPLRRSLSWSTERVSSERQEPCMQSADTQLWSFCLVSLFIMLDWSLTKMRHVGLMMLMMMLGTDQ